MNHWTSVAAFSFSPDKKKSSSRTARLDRSADDIAVPIAVPAWVPQPNGGERAALMAYAATLVFHVYHKCLGDDAVVVVDGEPSPAAIPTPFALTRDSATFTDLAAAVGAAVTSAAAEAADHRNNWAAALVPAPCSPLAQDMAASKTIVLGGGCVLHADTVESVGAASLLEAFDVVWVVPGVADAPLTATVSVLHNGAVYPRESPDKRQAMLRMTHAAGDGLGAQTAAQVKVLSDSMSARLLVDWQPSVKIPKHETDRTMHELFADTLRTKMADPAKQLAVVENSTGRTMDYATLELRSTRLALWLRRRLPEVAAAGRWSVNASCGIHIPRGADWYVLMLGIWKAGGSYLSLDPEFPADRLLDFLDDSGAVVLLTVAALKDRLAFTGAPIIVLEDCWAEIDAVDIAVPRCTEDWGKLPEELTAAGAPTASSPCYVIYTSGSTGKPKGVLLEHGNVTNFVMSERYLLELDNKQRIIQQFSTSFDASVEEIWLAFAGGGALIVVEKKIVADVAALADVIVKHKATVFSTVPSLLAVLDAKKVACLELVIAGAEACNDDVVLAYATNPRRFMNSYGPTEATVACMADFSEPSRPVTIGRPTPGYFAIIIDPETMEMLPPGVPGELLMAGPSVARGYMERPLLNAEKFIPCPYVPGDDPDFKRMYRTGDLTRWTPEGRVEFLGRIDSQVKLRGYRIELGEIETALGEYPGVTSAIVHVIKDMGHDFLCGYIIRDAATKDVPFAEADFKNYLKKETMLPAYMIPLRYVSIDKVPRSLAGKLDRRQLPLPEVQALSAEDAREKTDNEEAVSQIFEKALKFPIGVTACFFEAGGNSLLAGQVASKLRQAGFHDFDTRTLYENTSVEKIAKILDGMSFTTVGTLDDLPKLFEPSLLRRLLFLFVQMLTFHVSLVFQWTYLIAFVYCLVNYADQIHNDFGYIIGPLFFACFFNAAMFTTLFGFNFMILPVVKLLIFACPKPGDYSVWSVYFLRWWIIKTLSNTMPMNLFFGTAMMNLHCRLMGMDVGAGALLNTRVVDFDFFHVGDDVYVGDNVAIGTSGVEDHMLVLRHIRVGNCSSLMARSGVEGDTVIGEECVISSLCSVSAASRIGDRELWVGAPGKYDGPSPSLSELHPTSAWAGPPATSHSVNESEDPFMAPKCIRPNVVVRFIWGVVHLLYVLIVSILVANPTGALFYISWILFTYLKKQHDLDMALLVLPIAPALTAVVMIYQHLAMAVIRWIIFPWSPKAGNYGRSTFLFHQKIMLDVLAKYSLLYAHSMYGSAYTAIYLKLMGVKVGKRVECSNLFGFTPGLTVLGDECFIADFVGLNPPEVFRGVLTLGKVVVKNRAFVGNGAVIRNGITIAEGSLVGLSSCPVRSTVAGETIIGSPGFTMPRAKAEHGDDKARFQPSCWLLFRRGVWELFRCVMPSAFTTYSALLAFLSLIPITGSTELKKESTMLQFIILLNVYVWVLSVLQVLFIWLCKWIVVWRYKPTSYPLFSPGVWHNEFVIDVATFVGLTGILGMMRGTPFLPAFYRTLGAHLGKDLYLDSIFLTEPDLITIGDHCCVNEHVTLQCHLFEDRVMKLDRLEIADRVSIGGYCVVLYSSNIAAGCKLGGLSLVMKGESFPSMTNWGGIPAKLSEERSSTAGALTASRASGIATPNLFQSDQSAGRGMRKFLNMSTNSEFSPVDKSPRGAFPGTRDGSQPFSPTVVVGENSSAAVRDVKDVRRVREWLIATPGGESRDDDLYDN
jgi:non-ribosomal peptide synthetase-like protein